MRSPSPDPSPMPWLIAAAISAALGLSGFAWSENLSTTGYSAQRDGTITRVADDGPAARAGIRDGDEILGVDSEPYGDAVTRFRRGRLAIGTDQRLDLARGDERISATLTTERVPTGTLSRYIAAAGIGLVFLLAGVSTHLRRGTGTSRVAALIGVAAGTSFGLVPYISATTPRLVFTIVLGTAGILFLPMLVEVVLRFPDGSPPRTAIRAALYAPAGLIGIGFALAIFVTPSIYRPANILSTAYPAALVLTALVAAVVRWRRADPGPTRRLRGLLLAALAAGILPLVIGLLASDLPGSNNYFLTIVAIPLTIAYGLRSEARANGILGVDATPVGRT